MIPLVACPNCGRDSTTLTRLTIDYGDTHTVRYQVCSGCATAVEVALLQRRYDNQRYALIRGNP